MTKRMVENGIIEKIFLFKAVIFFLKCIIFDTNKETGITYAIFTFNALKNE